ncbi:MAG: hypothetical protein JWN71_1313 [Xanthobacteraceae bacterium]|jgi:hypothetical protein|nr:hypothetical protein [Xanthobacteraceae bacterium]
MIFLENRFLLLGSCSNGRKAPRGIRQNRYALSVAKERNFTKAATRLNIAANTFNFDKEPTEWRSKSQRSN